MWILNDQAARWNLLPVIILPAMTREVVVYLSAIPVRLLKLQNVLEVSLHRQTVLTLLHPFLIVTHHGHRLRLPFPHFFTLAGEAHGLTGWKLRLVDHEVDFVLFPIIVQLDMPQAVLVDGPG
jgi:hypothetical protein